LQILASAGNLTRALDRLRRRGGDKIAPLDCCSVRCPQRTVFNAPNRLVSSAERADATARTEVIF